MKTGYGNKKTPGRTCGLAFLPLLLAAFLCGGVWGCAPALVDDPAMLDEAVRSARASCAGDLPHGGCPGMWREGVRGVDAVLAPKSRAYGESGLTLNAMYRADAEGNARFALFLPQGGKLGQCERNSGGTSCSNAAFTGASQLVAACFAALDEIFTLRPHSADAAPDATDAYELRDGDRRLGLEAGKTVLLRGRRVAHKAYFVLYGSDGRLIGAYMRDTSGPHGMAGAGNAKAVRTSDWKALFGENPDAYTFYPQTGTLSIDVLVTGTVTGK